MSTKKYYDISNLLSVNADYNLLVSERTNGKSYQVKKYVIRDFVQNGNLFVYLRRWSEDIKEKEVSSYFGDVPVSEWTNGEYTGIIAYQGFFYFFNLDGKQKVVKGPVIGRYLALNLAERYKSQTFINYNNFVYEEFITNKVYIEDEPRELMQLVSTVARDRDIKVFMIGNTLSRVNPYYHEWTLKGALKMKDGEIQLYHFKTISGEETTVAVEKCGHVENKSRMFFGQAAKQILSGEWDCREETKLPKGVEYETVYEVKVIYQDFSFIIQLLIDATGGRLCFVYPFNGVRRFSRVITDAFSTDPLITPFLDVRRPAERMIIDNWRNKKFCFSDNLTGADFRNVLVNFPFM